MKYSEPRPPEHINVTPVHPLRELLVLLGGALALVLLLGLLLGLAGGKLARLLPYDRELRLAHAPDAVAHQVPPALAHYLNRLSTRLQPFFSLPDGMQVALQVSPAHDVNAVAMLGGHIVLYRGLLRKLPNENALSMLLAHEMAHLARRHPIEALGENAAVQLGMALLGGDLGLLRSAGGWVALGYSRAMEAEADDAALQAVRGVYGHLAGADALFEVLLAETGNSQFPGPATFFGTHPAPAGRLDRIRAAQAGNPVGRVTPLPDDFAAWLAAVR